MIALRFPGALLRGIQALLIVLAMGAFAWAAAHWIWRAAAPAAAPALVQQDSDWSARITSGSALGFSRAEPAALAPAPATPGNLEGRIRLLGIAREAGGREHNGAQALFKIDNRRILWLRPGDELDAGYKLAAVDADGVRITHDGRDIRLPLREPRAPASRPGTPLSAPARLQVPQPVADACKLAPEQRSRAYVLRPEIVDGVMRERAGWAELFKATAEGVLVQNPGGTGAMLGLYANDLLSKADGAQLSGAEDVLRLILQPLARNGSVIVTGARGGQPREWIYAGMTCLQR